MATPSTRPGVGATVFAGGVTFRTWAPHANSVSVHGDFDGWNGHALARQPDGYWSVDVAGAGPGQRYKYQINGHWRQDARARDLDSSVGECVITGGSFQWQHDFAISPWNELVIYEMHLGTFPEARVGNGQLLDAAMRDLPELAELGINAVELLPMGEFPGDDSLGYNPSHIFAVESAYGGPEQLKRFIDGAHRLGIAVILDVVYNHLGPNDLAIWQYDGWFQQFNGRDMGGIYFYNDARAWTAWTEAGRPDYGRPEVRDFIRDNAAMWLEEFRLDGLRLDATAYIRNVKGEDPPSAAWTELDGRGWTLLQSINHQVDIRQPWKLVIAEDLRGNDWITRPIDGGGAGCDSQWDGGFHWAIRNALVAVRDEDRDVGAVAAAIERLPSVGAFARDIYTESHDTVNGDHGNRRIPDAVAPGDAGGWLARKRSTLGAAALFTSPGIPMIFQGQEMLEWRTFGSQQRMDWSLQQRFPGIGALYRDLIHLRRNWFDTTRGLSGQGVEVFHANSQTKLVAFHRWREGGPRDDVVVVLNFSSRAFDRYRIGLPRGGRWRVRFNSDARVYGDDYSNFRTDDLDAGGPGWDGQPFSGEVAVGPYTAVILSQDH